MPNIVSPASKKKNIPKNRTVVSVLLSVLVIISDQFSKHIAINSLNPAESVTVLKGVFHLTLVYNTGAAFSLLRGNNVLFIFISLAVIAYIAVYVLCKVKKGGYLSFPVALILAGAVGNLIDRLRFGCVVDFLDFRIWPVFNIADSAITIGVALLCIRYFFR